MTYTGCDTKPICRVKEVTATLYIVYTLKLHNVHIHVHVHSSITMYFMHKGTHRCSNASKINCNSNASFSTYNIPFIKEVKCNTSILQVLMHRLNKGRLKHSHLQRLAE